MAAILKSLRALSDPTRLRIVALLELNELSVHELQEITRLGQSRISTHLGLLQDAGLVESRREGKRTFYKIASPREGAAGEFIQLAARGASELPDHAADQLNLRRILLLGIALLRFLTQLGGSGSYWGLTAAHTVIVLPYVLRLVVAAATGFDRSIAQAAQSLGASGWTVFRRIELPLIVPGVAGGWLIAFINSFDELTMSIFVASAGTQTLPVKMYNHIANTIDPLLASISTVLIVLTLVLMMVLDRFYGLDRVLAGKP